MGVRRDAVGDPDLRPGAALRGADRQGGGGDAAGAGGGGPHGGDPAPALQLSPGRVRAHAGVLGQAHGGQAGFSGSGVDFKHSCRVFIMIFAGNFTFSDEEKPGV